MRAVSPNEQQARAHSTPPLPSGHSLWPQLASEPRKRACSPECIDVGSFGEGQLILVFPGGHLSNNLRSQVAQPVVGQLQLVLTPRGREARAGTWAFQRRQRGPPGAPVPQGQHTTHTRPRETARLPRCFRGLSQKSDDQVLLGRKANKGAGGGGAPYLKVLGRLEYVSAQEIRSTRASHRCHSASWGSLRCLGRSLSPHPYPFKIWGNKT